QEQVLAGLVELTGPGLKVTLDDSTIKNVPPDEEAGNYLVHEYFLRDTINALWANGAEAISLNGERIVSTTSIYCVGSTILVNSTRLSPPYVFLAIGDAKTMKAGLDNPDTLWLVKQRVQKYGLQFNIEQANQLKVPAFDGTLHTKYAQQGTGKAN
ncbi:MAG: DUF881 domain-containing protein, partial [Chloroflexota bacterium]